MVSIKTLTKFYLTLFTIIDMIYTDFKKWLEEHRQHFVLGVCFILVFFLGFGVGKFNKYQNSKQKLQIDYSKNSISQQNQKKTVGEGNETVDTLTISTSSSTNTTITECKIKGNISSGGKKIYHIKGGASYNVVKPEMCFSSEEEAKAGGFVKSLR